MSTIIDIHAREILDSRGNPTVEVEVLLENGIRSRAAVPSGASKGKYEAVELRDGDANRYNGKGVIKVVEFINNELFPLLNGRKIIEQRAHDFDLITYEGTRDKSRAGANALLGVSLALAKAAANEARLPLYKYLGGVNAKCLPMPLMNIINGGAHANNLINIQEFMIVPVGASCFKQALRMGTEVFHALKAELKHSNNSTNVGDEGGFAPNLPNITETLDIIVRAIEKANYRPGLDIALALDVAASELYKDNKYYLESANQFLEREALIEYYDQLVRNFPIVSIEDAMAEDDIEGWQLLASKLGNHLQLVGDDLFATNKARLAMGIEHKLANSILIKPNQIGTLSETLDVIEIAHKASFTCIVSHRSGETEDVTIADLAVATNCRQIKAGAPSRLDRVAKYNQLLRIEEELGSYAEFHNPFSKS